VFHLVLIKPTHYDGDGYPIQCVKAAIPSNTLACLNGLAEDASQRRVLGPDVVIRVRTYDETNRRVRPDRIVRIIRRAGGRALIGLVGVQSNQFPRAVDLARPFLHAGMPVCIGGFHVSGLIAMLPEMPAEMREAAALGVSFFAGEAEHGRLDWSPFAFYPRYAGEIASKARRYWSVYRQARAILKEILAAPDRWTSSDLAITSPVDDEFDRLDLYRAAAGGEGALARKRREDALRMGARGVASIAAAD